MKPRINVITLAVKDLDRSIAFYKTGLGWPTEGIVGQDIENGMVAFFNLSNGLTLALWPKQSLLNDAKLTEDANNKATTFSLAYNVNSKEEVDNALKVAATAGAVIVDSAQDRSWGGYSGYFTDLDGHLWDVVWNPELRVES